MTSWEDIDRLRCEVEGLNPDTGRQFATPNIAARDGMRKLYAERIAKGLNAHGKPLVAPEKRNHRYGFVRKTWKLGTPLELCNRHVKYGKRKYQKQWRAWRNSPLWVKIGDARFDDNYAAFTRLMST